MTCDSSLIICLPIKRICFLAAECYDPPITGKNFHCLYLTEWMARFSRWLTPLLVRRRLLSANERRNNGNEQQEMYQKKCTNNPFHCFNRSNRP